MTLELKRHGNEATIQVHSRPTVFAIIHEVACEIAQILKYMLILGLLHFKVVISLLKLIIFYIPVMFWLSTRGFHFSVKRRWMDHDEHVKSIQLTA